MHIRLLNICGFHKSPLTLHSCLYCDFVGHGNKDVGKVPVLRHEYTISNFVDIAKVHVP
jgi:hypothetical protein